MKKQFLREHHARQDKAGKPDYLEGMARTYSFFSIQSAVPTEEAIDVVISHIRTLHFCQNGLKFRFKWTLEDFVRVNRLSPERNASKDLNRLRRIAQSDLRTLSTAIKDAWVWAARRIDGVEYGVQWDVPKLKCNSIKGRRRGPYIIGWHDELDAKAVIVFVLEQGLSVHRWEYRF